MSASVHNCVASVEVGRFNVLMLAQWKNNHPHPLSAGGTKFRILPNETLSLWNAQSPAEATLHAKGQRPFLSLHRTFLYIYLLSIVIFPGFPMERRFVKLNEDIIKTEANLRSIVIVMTGVRWGLSIRVRTCLCRCQLKYSCILVNLI